MEFKPGERFKSEGSMHRIPVVCLALSLASQLVSAAFGAPPAVRPIRLAADPQLKRPARLLAPGRDLDALLEETARQTGIRLAAPNGAGDQKLVVAGERHPVGQVLDQIASHFDLRWTRDSPEEAPHASYRLVMLRERRDLPGKLRAATERQRSERMLARVEKAVALRDASNEARRQAGAADPYFDESPLNASQRARLELVALVPPADRKRAAAGEPYLSAPLSTLPTDVQNTALLAGGLSNRIVDLTKIRVVFRRESDEGVDRLRVSLIGSDGRPAGRSGDLAPHEPPRRASGIPVIGIATRPDRKPKDPAFDPIAELVDEKGNPLDFTAGLPRLLAAISRATRLDVISDYHACQTLRFDADPLGKRPLWQLLNIIAEQYCLHWERKGGFLLFRHREWYEVEAEEIPERLLRAWRTQSPAGEMVEPSDLLETLAALTPEQLGGFRYQFSGFNLSPPYRWERWLGTLSGEQRRSLVDGKSLAGDELSKPSQEQLRTLLARSEGQTPRVRMEVRNGMVRLVAEAGTAPVETGWMLPRKQALLPPVQVRLAATPE